MDSFGSNNNSELGRGVGREERFPNASSNEYSSSNYDDSHTMSNTTGGLESEFRGGNSNTMGSSGLGRETEGFGRKNEMSSGLGRETEGFGRSNEMSSGLGRETEGFGRSNEMSSGLGRETEGFGRKNEMSSGLNENIGRRENEGFGNLSERKEYGTSDVDSGIRRDSDNTAGLGSTNNEFSNTSSYGREGNTSSYGREGNDSSFGREGHNQHNNHHEKKGLAGKAEKVVEKIKDKF